MRVLAALAIVLGLVSMAGCGVLGGTSTADGVDDTTITAAVKTRLVADRTSNLTRIDVDTNNATVYLTGMVDSAEHKARAEQLAWEATGVRGVVNQLQVQRR